MTPTELKAICIIQTNGCWEKPKRVKTGYSYFRINKKLVKAHRISWEIHHGEIPVGLYVCHRCNNKKCLNPEHLYLATHRQNVIDAGRDGLLSHPCKNKGVRKTHCKRGHKFDPGNTYVAPSGMRICKTCQKQAENRYRTKNVEILAQREAARYLRRKALEDSHGS